VEGGKGESEVRGRGGERKGRGGRDLEDEMDLCGHDGLKFEEEAVVIRRSSHKSHDSNQS
jgi:hypothetical protein